MKIAEIFAKRGLRKEILVLFKIIAFKPFRITRGYFQKVYARFS
jgi:hypothetical protein